MEKFRFVLVGSGNIASTYVKAAANVPEIEIAGIVSRSGKRPAAISEDIKRSASTKVVLRDDN